MSTTIIVTGAVIASLVITAIAVAVKDYINWRQDITKALNTWEPTENYFCVSRRYDVAKRLVLIILEWEPELLREGIVWRKHAEFTTYEDMVKAVYDIYEVKSSHTEVHHLGWQPKK